jgi:hypothetical protein
MTNNTSPKLTLKMKVWAAVRNTPGMTSRDVWNKFPDVGQSTISSILSTLDFSAVIYSIKTPGETLKKYFTTYEIYPAKKLVTRTKPTAKANYTHNDVIIEYAHIPITTPKDDRIEELFNTLSLNESRQLYKRLQSIFGLEAVC